MAGRAPLHGRARACLICFVRLALGVTAVLLALGRYAAAEPEPRRVAVVAPAEGCPSAAQVMAALDRYLPGHALVAADVPDPEAWATAVVADEDTGYRVTCAGKEKRFSDVARRCGERARTAAVFVALLLRPPRADGDAPGDPGAAVTPAPSPPLAVAAPPPDEPARAGFLDLEAAGVVAVAPAGPVLVCGGALRLAGGWRVVGAALGATGLSPAAIDVGGGRARAVRIPLDLDLRLSLFRGRRAELTADLGLALDVIHASGLDLPANRSGVAVAPGLRLAAGLRVPLTRRLLALIALEALLHPGTTRLVVGGEGAAELPALWLGASLGVAARLR